jgi:sugar lactone lactonase YvrE
VAIRPDVDLVVELGAELGEGPVWDTRIGRLVWVDILGRRVHATDPRTGATTSLEVPLHVGAVAMRARGGYVAALQDGFWVLGDGAPRRIARIPEATPDLRFNDGKCDPAGRFWAGTMRYDTRPGSGSLYCLGLDGVVSRVVDGVTISNGLAWSEDGRTMYYVDSPTRRIDAFAFDVGSGALSDRRPLVAIPADAGTPDGLAVDCEGGIWVVLPGSGRVHRYVEGRLDRDIKVPVSQPTSCAFGDADLGTLFITSSREHMSAEELEREPHSGALFRVRPGVTGVPPQAYLGA